MNPFGLTSILTKSKGKSAAINRGSDYYRYPRIRIIMDIKNISLSAVYTVNGQEFTAKNLKNEHFEINLRSSADRI